MACRARRRLLLRKGEGILGAGETGHGARVQPEDGDRGADGRGQRKRSAAAGQGSRQLEDCREEANHFGSQESCNARRGKETADAQDREGFLNQQGASREYLILS